MQTSPNSRVVVIQNKQGLHARPADQFARLASQFDAKIDVVREDRRITANSVMDLLTLGAFQGTQLTLVAVGNDAQQAIDDVDGVDGARLALDGVGGERRDVRRPLNQCARHARRLSRHAFSTGEGTPP